MSNPNSLKYCKFVIALVALVVPQQQIAHAQPIETLTNHGNDVQQLPIENSSNNFAAPWATVAAVENSNDKAENVRKARHIIGGGGFIGGFKTYGASAPPVYPVPIVQQVPIVTTVPVVSSISAVPAYGGVGYGGGGFGYPGYGGLGGGYGGLGGGYGGLGGGYGGLGGGYGGGGLVGGGFTKFAVKGFGVGGGFLG